MPRRATGKPAPQPKRQPAPKPEEPDRSEEDILLQRIEVTLADKPYTIKLLPIRPQTEWRKKSLSLVYEFMATEEDTSKNPAEVQAGLTSILIGTPEKMRDLFFEYARDLDRDEIENTAMEAEVAVAFEKIVAIVMPSPLVTALTAAVR